MSTIRLRGEAVRRFVIDNVQKHPNDIVRVAAERFACSRQAIHKHIQRLVAEGALTQTGSSRRMTYGLAALAAWRKTYALGSGVTEDQVWREDVRPILGNVPGNVMSIWQYGFTEMFNNAIDHSSGKLVSVKIEKTAAATEIALTDDGVGIFRKIQGALGLADERHAVLELAKGKFTTDPKNHSGEGIFFASRMFDAFEILSGGVYFSHDLDEKEDWILQPSEPSPGTFVRMLLHNHTARTTKKVFDKFASGDDYGFNKTVVPVKLMRYGDDNLVSRSQAKRLLARFDRFKVVMLDFSGIASVGQAFADEVFRVFHAQHPQVEIIALRASPEVRRMIARAQGSARSDTAG